MPNPIVRAREVNDHGRIYMQHMYWCPGCDMPHAVAVKPGVNGIGAGWIFTGTLECPTYSPSQLTKYKYGPDQKQVICHTFIKAGQIQYLNDCTHAMAGQTVPLPPLPDWLIRED